MALVCCQLVKKGRFVAAEPWFEGGALISIAHAKRYATDVGKLAVVDASARGAGRVIEVVGAEDDIRAVMRCLLAERGALGDAPRGDQQLGEPPAGVQDQVDALEDGVPLMDQREDLRSQLAVTIDPNNARDHDDAVAFEPDNAAGGLAGELWVHIADVSAFVPTGSALDEYAAERAFSTYVPGMVAPMLPERLSADFCSLRAGVDRGCVSVCLVLDAEGATTKVRFARTVIRSARRLTYDQVDEVLDKRSSVDPIIDELLVRLDALTRVLRQRRIERGALDMALPDIAFELGERTVERAHLEFESPSHRLIEECMLLANGAVGHRLAQAQAPALFRVHEHPDPLAVEKLLSDFEQMQVPTPPVPETMSGADAAKVAVAAAKLARTYSEQRGRGLNAFAPRVLRSLSQAVYQPRSGPHSGLATVEYAHFTSPIRRYPDLVNHRSLLRQIGLSDEAPAAWDLPMLGEHASFVEREGMKVERRANDIARAHLLYDELYVRQSNREGRWTGEVVGLIGAGLFIRFGDVYEGFLPARRLAPGEERFQLDEAGLAMVGTSSGRRIRLGDAIDVYVERIDRARGKVDLSPVGR